MYTRIFLGGPGGEARFYTLYIVRMCKALGCGDNSAKM